MSPVAVHVPVSEGTTDAVTRDAGPFRVTHATFPAHGRIATHTHDRACIPVMLEGAFDVTFPGHQTIVCGAGTLAVEPLGDCHCNRISALGANVLVLQPDPAETDTLRPVARRRICHLQSPNPLQDGR
jgi:quercetin dioxygenase-like cupin family protein